MNRLAVLTLVIAALALNACGSLSGMRPSVKPYATRAGMPCRRSTSAIDPENIWQ